MKIKRFFGLLLLINLIVITLTNKITTKAITADQLEFSTNISHNLNNPSSTAIPTTYSKATQVDLTKVDAGGVFQGTGFYYFIEVKYKNNSSSALTGAKIEIDLPKINEQTYYYANNVVSSFSIVAGTYEFPANQAGNSVITVSNSKVTISAINNIFSSASGNFILLVKSEAPFTNLGSRRYNTKLVGNEITTGLTDYYDLTISGLKPNVDNLGTYPSANIHYPKTSPDLKVNPTLSYFPPNISEIPDYYFSEYSLGTPFLASSYDLIIRGYLEITIPTGVVIENLSNECIKVNNTIQCSQINTYNSTFYWPSQFKFTFKYPKTIYNDPYAFVDLKVKMVGNYYRVENDSQIRELWNKTFSLKVSDSSKIPDVDLGKLDTPWQGKPYEISKQALETGVIPFNATNTSALGIGRIGGNTLIDELTFNFERLDWFTNGLKIPANYGINRVVIGKGIYTGVEDPKRKMTRKIYFKYSDGNEFLIEELEGVSNFTNFDQTVRNNNLNSRLIGVRVVYRNVLPDFKLKSSTQNQFEKDGFIVSGWVKDYATYKATSLIETHSIGGYNYPDLTGYRAVVPGTKNYEITNPIVDSEKYSGNVTLNGPANVTLNSDYDLKITGTNNITSSMPLINPKLSVLLPAGVTYRKTNSNMAILPGAGTLNGMNEPLLNTVTPNNVKIIDNFAGTNQQLIVYSYSGKLNVLDQVEASLQYRVESYAKAGDVFFNAYLSADNLKMDKMSGSNIINDTLDFDDDRKTFYSTPPDKVFTAPSLKSLVGIGEGFSGYTTVKGAYNNTITNIAQTGNSQDVEYNMHVSYTNKNEALKNIKFITKIPFEGDTKNSQWGSKKDNQAMTLKNPITLPSFPNAKVYYTSVETENLNDPNWNLQFNPNAKSVKIEMGADFEMISGKTTYLEIKIPLIVPGTSDFNQLSEQAGKVQLKYRIFSDTILPIDGFESGISTVETIPKGIKNIYFQDQNRNGIKESNETYASGSLVELYQLDRETNISTLISTTQTNSDGEVILIDGINNIYLSPYKYYYLKYKLPEPTNNYEFIENSNFNNLGIYTPSEYIDFKLLSYAQKEFEITGKIWFENQNPPNQVYDELDVTSDLSNRQVNLFNVTKGKYEGTANIDSATGNYKFVNIPKGDRYRVEFEINSQIENPVPVKNNFSLENIMLVGDKTNIYYEFESEQLSEKAITIDGALVTKGTVIVNFWDENNQLLETKSTLANLPVEYSAKAVKTEDDFTNSSYGYFQIPDGYILNSEQTNPQKTMLSYQNKSSIINFKVDKLKTVLNLNITSDQMDKQLLPGDKIKYTIKITNVGNLVSEPGTINSLIPEKTKLLTIDPNLTVNNNLITSDVVSIEPNQTIEFSYTVQLLDRLASENIINWEIINEAKFNNVLSPKIINNVIIPGDKPIIQAEQYLEFTKTDNLEIYNVMENITISDREEGDLTNNAIITINDQPTLEVNLQQPGVYRVLIQITDRENNQSELVQVIVVKDGNIEVGNEYVLMANDYTIRLGQASKEPEIIKNQANIKIFNKQTGIDITQEKILQVLVNQDNYLMQVGQYELKYQLQEKNTQLELSKKAIIITGQSPAIITPEIQIIRVNDNFNPMSVIYAIDPEDGEITNKVSYKTNLNLGQDGVYVVEYTVIDSDYNITTKNLIIVVENGNYVVGNKTIIKANSYEIPISQVLVDQNSILERAQVEVFDKFTGQKITNYNDVTINYREYQAKLGMYYITYQVNYDNLASITNTALVTRGQKPIINFEKTTIIDLNQDFDPLANVSVSDKEDGDITNKLTYQSNVNNAEIGLYTVTYNISDSDGNEISEQRVVIVKNNDVVIGTNYVIIAKDFTKYVHEVNTINAEIIKHAQVKVYNKADATLIESPKLIVNKGSYTQAAGQYPIEFIYRFDQTAKITKTANIISGENPQIIVDKLKVIEKNSKFDPYQQMQIVDFEEGQIPNEQANIIGDFDSTKTGVYQLKYEVYDRDKNYQSAQQLIVVKGDGVVIGEKYILIGTNYAYKGEQFTTENAVQLANFKVYDIASGLEVLDPVVEINFQNIEQARNVYEVSFVVVGSTDELKIKASLVNLPTIVTLEPNLNYILGTATSQAKIQLINVDNQKYQTTADENGNWIIYYDPTTIFSNNQYIQVNQTILNVTSDSAYFEIQLEQLEEINKRAYTYGNTGNSYEILTIYNLFLTNIAIIIIKKLKRRNDA